jgi:S-adenosylmethionine:tRNA ribosyltransferase-isomerase
MRLSDFDYVLPEELIAQYPLQKRDTSRMIVLDRSKGESRETLFSNFPRYLHEGDIVVVNDTRVIPARLLGEKGTGAKVEIFLTSRLGGGRWLALCKPSRRLRQGDDVLIEGSSKAVRLEVERENGEWIVVLPTGTDEMSFIKDVGHMPLPPYIRRPAEDIDRKRYQTVFARVEGSVAAPTAGLHFTEEICLDLKRRGIAVLPVTLHVGPGTFRPLTDETIEKNELQPEYVRIRRDLLDEILTARSIGRRIVAVGTTVTRALESIAADTLDGGITRDGEGTEHLSGWTDLFIYPGFEFKVVDSLLTNLHLPRSSLLVLVSAFAGRERVLSAYRWAIGRKFRFYSYGDVMYIR